MASLKLIDVFYGPMYESRFFPLPLPAINFTPQGNITQNSGGVDTELHANLGSRFGFAIFSFRLKVNLKIL